MTPSGTTSCVRCLAVLMVAATAAFAGCSQHTEPALNAPLAPVAGPAGAPDTAGMKITVSISPALSGKAAPDDTVFVFARAAQGPRMPLAIARQQVKDLPVTVVLDDSSAMSPEMKLSSVPHVVVVARVSKSGMAGARNGDLEGVSGVVKTGQAVALSIDRVVNGK